MHFVLIFCLSALLMGLYPLEYYRGREGFEHEKLRLYQNQQYAYEYWMHLGNYVKDTGTYIRDNDKLILISIISKKGNSRIKNTRKADTTFKYFDSDTLFFHQDSVTIFSRNKNPYNRTLRRK